MPLSLLPKVIAGDITRLTPEYLKSQGIRLLMMDFDNTIVPYTTNIPTQAVVDWFDAMKASDVRMCVVSNSKNDRVKIFCDKYGIDCITHAKKPFSKGIRQCLDRYQLPAQECALVGDQIYTDILGANSCGVRSILVKAIHNHNFWLKARHLLELPPIFLAGKRKIR